MNQSIKTGFKYAVHVWGYHLIAALMGVAFITSMSGTWGIIINSLLIVGIVAIALNEGAYQGEKACTVTATIEKQEKEGRRVSELQRKMVYKRSVAAWIMIFGCLPFLLLSTLNLLVKDGSEQTVVEQTQQTAESQKPDGFAFNYGDEEEQGPALSISPVRAVTRVVFSSYVAFYSMMSSSMLYIMFFVFSLPVAASMAVGYLCGPYLRKRKLYDIAAGKKRKQLNLKVNKKPRRPKAEV